MANHKNKLCLPLPGYLTNCVTLCKSNEQYLLNFLQNLLPRSDCKSVTDEMRKTFIFNKFKLKLKQSLHHNKGKSSLSTRKRVYLGLDKICRTSQIKYRDLLPVNQLWLRYMQSLLGVRSFTSLPQDPDNPNLENIGQQLMKADFHGAEISIDSSRCPTLVGLRGIVIQDTKNTFKICGADNVIRTVPKNLIKLSIYLDNGVVLKTFGRQLSVKPVERTSKKLKNTKIVQL